VYVPGDGLKVGVDATGNAELELSAAPSRVTLPVPELMTHLTVSVVVLPAAYVNV
jgi:hypothetical protein